MGRTLSFVGKRRQGSSELLENGRFVPVLIRSRAFITDHPRTAKIRSRERLSGRWLSSIPKARATCRTSVLMPVPIGLSTTKPFSRARRTIISRRYGGFWYSGANRTHLGLGRFQSNRLKRSLSPISFVTISLDRRRSAWPTLINTSPMIFRFSSGSTTRVKGPIFLPLTSITLIKEIGGGVFPD